MKRSKFVRVKTIHEQALTLIASVLGGSKHKSAKLKPGPKEVGISRISKKKTKKTSKHPPTPIMPVAKPIEPNGRDQ